MVKDQLGVTGVALRGVPAARDVKDGQGGERVCYDVALIASMGGPRT